MPAGISSLFCTAAATGSADAEGTPEQIAQDETSYTGQFLKKVFAAEGTVG